MAADTLSLSWHDPAWIHILNPSNVMDYFSDKNNPFYDRTCNNEIIKMQRGNQEQLGNMTGLEYILLHVQEPILYVIRKQHRHSQSQVAPLADYYIIAGIVYQAPDLGSVISSRLLNTTHALESAFEEANGFSKYHPSKGYWWEFKDHKQTEELLQKDKKKKEEPSSIFQRQRVDVLLAELSRKYPVKYTSVPSADKPAEEGQNEQVKVEIKTEKKDENSLPQNNSMKPPPEKKAKMLR
ncbi:hypothetical protein CAPTEDRAFT_168225 [Capitella teleta]|uniref:Mediator of RNA polymerase II transcription subunit 6 n=1 Tax=Capitella teleta TaxID=283909 RepID=R7ULS6_CAPTE|nr:hypothetical protein CAPTEDRAFT_168225 [Capitella teleta]|eukprot:ELU04232.1 hypothetical protein CAPTEDRAFT_168225 [Capitella teleta]